MEKNRKQVWKKYSLQIALALLLAVILVTLAGWWLYFRVLEQSSLDEGKGGREYARHYMQKVVKGLVLLAAVIFDVVSKKKSN